MLLKNYQDFALTVLKNFCIDISNGEDIQNAYKKAREYGKLDEVQYFHANCNAPYVCMRVPTGGGKTLLATHSIPVIAREYLDSESLLVFWLAPSEAIVTQTINALKNRQHPYRQYLDDTFEGRDVKVLSSKEALSTSFSLAEDVVIIVSTIQVFRVENEEGRKFYEQNGTFAEFFPDDVEPSLAAYITKLRPYIIVDEAHKARTSLSMDKLIALNPSFILELTATPQTTHAPSEGKYASNIICTITASQLKAEDMIKMPIVLKLVDEWKIAVRDAVMKQKELEQLAMLDEANTGEYIRPLLLFGAENKNGEASHENLTDFLINDIGLDREQIAVHTGDKKELDGIDISSKSCEVRFVITVDALKEGWDAPFAYILCSVASIKSSTAVEQFLGRVLRMPYATPKKTEDLSCAYAYVSTKNFYETANNLRENLVQNGFDRLEAKYSIRLNPNSNPNADIGGLFSDTIINSVEVGNFDISAISEKAKEYINYNKETKKINFVKPIAPTRVDAVMAEIKKATGKEDFEKIEELAKETPQIARPVLRLPKLGIKEDGAVFEFDKATLIEQFEWDEKEALKQAKLLEDEFDIAIESRAGIIDIGADAKLKVNLEETKRNLFEACGIDIAIGDKEIARRCAELVAHRDIEGVDAENLTRFTHAIVLYLLKERKFDPIALWTNCTKLSQKIADKIEKLQKKQVKNIFNALLKGATKWSGADEYVFDPERYSAIADHRSETFKKHYLPIVHKLGKGDEEFNCASFIDGLDEVEYWIKNVDRDDKNSFWLQTSTDKFYPDFIVRLKSGKMVVVEYKGEHLESNDDTQEKEILGKVWESVSGQTFLMVGKNDYKTKIREAFKKII